VIIKETVKYLRGRSSNEELNEHYIAGIKAGGKNHWAVMESELAALQRGLADSHGGDLIAMMCVEQVAKINEYLTEVGKPSPLGQPAK
jgi:hypothetical protein